MDVAENEVSKSTYRNFHKVQNSVIYDNKGNVIANLSSDANSKYLIYPQISQDIINAFVAVEDRNYWLHKGVDPKGIARVLIDFVKSNGKEMHGASTITQQLVKNTFLTQEKTMDRKLSELAYSIALEQKYSKENIMEFYINNIYFGNQQYGVEAASVYYFQKSSSELSLAEYAYLAAIPNSPNYYDPVKHPEHTKKRQEKILKDMHSQGMISDSKYKKSLQEKIQLNVDDEELRMDDQATYAVYCSVIEIMKQDGFDFRYAFSSLSKYKDYKKEYDLAYSEAKTKLYAGGYRIYTSLDSKSQDILQKAVDKNLAAYKKKENGIYALQGAATCIDNETGKVTAIVGGRLDPQNSITLNRAFESKRQPGSSIKPLIVYGPAIDRGYTANSTLREVNVSGYKKGSSGPAISLRQALIHSKNGAAYWLANRVGITNCLQYLRNMQFGSIVGEDETLSASLGGLTVGVNTVEMASGYYCLYNDGKYIPPTCITKMKNMDGTDIYFADKEKQVYQRSTSEKLISIMEGVITEGTASKNIKWTKGVFAAGKTGTTNDSKDGWFCGMTKKETLAVWVGYDKPKTLSDLYGNTYPVSIWKQYMESSLGINNDKE